MRDMLDFIHLNMRGQYCQTNFPPQCLKFSLALMMISGHRVTFTSSAPLIRVKHFMSEHQCPVSLESFRPDSIQCQESLGSNMRFLPFFIFSNNVGSVYSPQKILFMITIDWYVDLQRRRRSTGEQGYVSTQPFYQDMADAGSKPGHQGKRDLLVIRACAPTISSEYHVAVMIFCGLKLARLEHTREYLARVIRGIASTVLSRPPSSP